jgi:phosphate transport system permease protein
VNVFIWSLAIVLAITLGTYILGVARANRLSATAGNILNSLPSYHGMLGASLALLVGTLATLVASTNPELPLWAAPVAAAAGSSLAALYGLKNITPSFRARRRFEFIILNLLLASSVVAILTTFGIFASVAFESFAFFKAVNPLEFLFGSKWTPTGSPPSFGFLPLLAGTVLITTIAISVAAPLGLLSAIYMAEYASPRLRQILKPLLEMLAGIPTVVLGFFAALTMAPLIRHTGESIGLVVASESALAAGLVMGMMIVPLISSLSDDIINAVPQSLRDGSYAMGATHSETIKRVVLPAALPGIVSAIMLAISRAVGETMIVVMAAGLAANLSFNPLAAVSTITVQIATLLVGDQEFDSAKTLSAFALGIVLFFFTLALNYVALRFVKKYRQAYD